MIRTLFSTVISVINKAYCGRPFSRFYVLETLACVPYYAHASVRNIYEKLGLARQSDILEMHFLESWNEFHHLLVMETLEGDRYWYDRLLARSVTVGYYWILVVICIANPREFYGIMELVSRHAYDGYSKFLDECKQELIIRPTPPLILEYIQTGVIFLDELSRGHKTTEPAVPVMNLYDVFSAIRSQEMEHVKTIQAYRESNAKLLMVN
jgi:ubiquinol oxidase